jgi:hypothetical protein
MHTKTVGKHSLREGLQDVSVTKECGSSAIARSYQLTVGADVRCDDVVARRVVGDDYPSFSSMTDRPVGNFTYSKRHQQGTS